MNSLFGGQQMTPPGGMGGGRNFGDRDFSNFDPGNMPSMPGGSGGGGGRPGGFGGGQ